MPKDLHFSDFKERISQLTDTEAVKEAYLAYLASLFPRCGVIRTPQSLRPRGVQMQDRPFVRVYDELVMVEGDGRASAMELASWMELARTAVLARLDRLLLTVSRSDQTRFFEAMRRLIYEQSEPFAAFLVEMGDSQGVDSVLISALPTGSQVFPFTPTVLAAIIPKCDDLRSRWLVHRATSAVAKTLKELGEQFKAAASVASWPADAASVGMLTLALQQGLKEAGRLQQQPYGRDPVLVFASEWVAHGRGPEERGDDGSAASPARTFGPDPDLRGGSARRLGEE